MLSEYYSSVTSVLHQCYIIVKKKKTADHATRYVISPLKNCYRLTLKSRKMQTDKYSSVAGTTLSMWFAN